MPLSSIVTPQLVPLLMPCTWSHAGIGILWMLLMEATCFLQLSRVLPCKKMLMLHLDAMIQREISGMCLCVLLMEKILQAVVSMKDKSFTAIKYSIILSMDFNRVVMGCLVECLFNKFDSLRSNVISVGVQSQGIIGIRISLF